MKSQHYIPIFFFLVLTAVTSVSQAQECPAPDPKAEELAACIESLPPCALNEEPDVSPEFPCGSCAPLLGPDERVVFITFPPFSVGPEEYVKINVTNPCVDGAGRVQLGVRNLVTGQTTFTNKRQMDAFGTIFTFLRPNEGMPRAGFRELVTQVRAVCKFGINLGDEILAVQTVVRLEGFFDKDTSKDATKEKAPIKEEVGETYVPIKTNEPTR